MWRFLHAISGFPKPVVAAVCGAAVGIGTTLLTALIDEARRRRAADVLLEVRADNPRAQQLYVRFGFEQIHIRPRYYRDGVDALIMRLQLAGEPGEGTAHGTTTEGPRP